MTDQLSAADFCLLFQTSLDSVCALCLIKCQDKYDKTLGNPAWCVV